MKKLLLFFILSIFVFSGYAEDQLLTDNANYVANLDGDRLYIQRYLASNNGTITQIRTYGSISGYVQVALYSDNSGEPGSLLTAGDTSAVTATSWTTIPISHTNITSGSYYWIGFILNGTGRISRGSTTGTRRDKSATYSGFSFPNPAGSGYFESSLKSMVEAWGTIGESSSGTQPAILLSIAGD